MILIRLSILLLLVACAQIAPPIARPIAVVRSGDVTLTFSREPCTLLPATTNLPFRATWAERGERFEGCYGIQHRVLIVAYWSDGTVTTHLIESARTPARST